MVLPNVPFKGLKAMMKRLFFTFLLILGIRVASAAEEPMPIRAGSFGKLSSEETTKFQWLKDRLGQLGVAADYIDRVFGDDRAGYYDDVIPQMTKPAEKTMTYERYRNIFIKPERLAEGRQFLIDHNAELQVAGTKYQVDKAALAGLIGVETRFGQHRGRYRAVNALATIAMGLDRRKEWAAKELATLLLLYKDHDVLDVMGSYAGAIGYPQFMPTSIKAYGVDGNGDNFVDLGNWEDAISSCANYLKKHGWKNGVAIEPDSVTYKAIYRYNPSKFYVQIVGEMAEQFGYLPKNPQPFFIETTNKQP